MEFKRPFERYKSHAPECREHDESREPEPEQSESHEHRESHDP